MIDHDAFLVLTRESALAGEIRLGIMHPTSPILTDQKVVSMQ